MMPSRQRLEGLGEDCVTLWPLPCLGLQGAGVGEGGVTQVEGFLFGGHFFGCLGSQLLFILIYRLQSWHIGLVALQHVGSQFPNQELSSHPLHCTIDSLPLDHQGDSLPLDHQGSPEDPLYMTSHFPCCFQDSVFHQFTDYVSWCESFKIYPSSEFAMFIGQQISCLHYIWNIFKHYFLSYSSCFLSLAVPLVLPLYV